MAHSKLLDRYLRWRREKSISIARANSDDSDSDVDTGPSDTDPISPTRQHHDHQPQPGHGEPSLPVSAEASAASPLRLASTKSPACHRNRNSSSATPTPPRPASVTPRIKQPGVVCVHELASSPAAAVATETSEVLPSVATGATTNPAPASTGRLSAAAACVAGLASTVTVPSTSGTASRATPAAHADVNVDLTAQNQPEMQQSSSIQEDPAATGAGLVTPPGGASSTPPTVTIGTDDGVIAENVSGEQIRDRSVDPASSADMDPPAAEVVSPGETSRDIAAGDNSGLVPRRKRRQTEVSMISPDTPNTDCEHANRKRRWRSGRGAPITAATAADPALEEDPAPEHEGPRRRGTPHVVESSPPACRTRSRFSSRPSLAPDAVDDSRRGADADTVGEDEEGETTSSASSSGSSSTGRVPNRVSSVRGAIVADGETEQRGRSGGSRRGNTTPRSATQRRRGACVTRARVRTPNRKAAGSRRAGDAGEVAAPEGAGSTRGVRRGKRRASAEVRRLLCGRKCSGAFLSSG